MVEKNSNNRDKIIAIQGDALESLKLHLDSSLLIASELYARGYKIFWYVYDKLISINSQVYATGYYLSIKRYMSGISLVSYEKISDLVTMDLSEVSCIMVRQNPPFNMQYITSTILLSILENGSEGSKIPFIMNSPSTIRNNAEKVLPISLSRIIKQKHNLRQSVIIPDTIITSDIKPIMDLLQKHDSIILKQLYNYGGQDVMKVSQYNTSKQIIEKFLQCDNHLPIIAQQFIPDVIYGDKRVVICDGEIVGVVKRTPMDGSFLTNIVAGATAETTTLNDEEVTLCKILALELQAMGIFLAGIDLLKGLIIEINITSPSLLVTTDTIQFSNTHQLVVDKMEQYFH